jgi:hypothetical protein
MNYNLLTDRMLMVDGNKKKTVGDNEVEYIGLELLKFVPLENDFGEIKVDGDKAILAIKHSAKIKVERGAQGISKDKLNKLLDANGPMPDGVSIVRDSSYYLVKQKVHTQRFYLAESIVEKANYRAFLKIFAKQSAKVNAYIQEQKIDFDKLDDLCKLLTFCEGLE